MRWLCRLFRTRLAARSALITLSSVGLLGALFLAGAVIINEQRERQREHQRLEELLTTVEPTVQIACFLRNRELAAEVASGLLSNRTLSRVVIEEGGSLLVDQSKGDIPSGETQALTRTIVSPFNTSENICEIRLVPNTEEIHRAVVADSLFVSVLLGLQVVGIGVVVVLIMVRFVTRPIHRVSRRLDTLEAETGQKLSIPKGNEHDEIGRLVISVNSMIDHLVSAITMERELRIEREVEERRYRSIFENVETGIFELDEQGRLVAANPAFMEMFGLQDVMDPAEKPFNLAEHVKDIPDLRELLATLEVGSSSSPLDVSLELKGRPHWISIVLTHIEEDRAQGVANDVTERYLAAQAAETLATTDTLTGLGNRRGLDRRLAAAMRVHNNDPEYRCALIMLDLDHFKEANDTFGHAVGDQVLQHVAGLLKNLVRKADYVARSGGDEFVILLDGASEREDLVRIAASFLEQVNLPILIDEDTTVHVGASLGIAVLGEDAHTVSELLRLADSAMYRAKNAGRNTYRFHGNKN